MFGIMPFLVTRCWSRILRSTVKIPSFRTVGAIHFSKDSTTTDLFPAYFMTKFGETITVDLGREEDFNDCCVFSREHLFRSQPLSWLLDKSALKKLDFVEPWTKGCITSNLSLVARNLSGQVVAVRMSEMSSREDPAQFPAQVLKHLEVLKRLNDNVDLFTMLNTEKLFHFVFLGVHQDYRRQGLAGKLFELSIELAIANGAGAVYVEAVNKYAAKAGLRNGFRIIKKLSLSELSDSIPQENFKQLIDQNPFAHLLALPLKM